MVRDRGTALALPVVWDERHRRHDVGGGIWLGVELASDETPARGDRLREAMVGAGATVHPATDHGDGPVLAVHTPDYLAFLRRAHRDWLAAGHQLDPGQPDVVPYVFSLPQATSGRPPRRATAIRAEVGQYAVDTMSPIGAGTYEAARAAVDVTLTAADLVLGGAAAAYAAVRPPGHHVGPGFYGGSCHLNNAACAAQHLVDRGGARVAIVDIDAHHGNGTQEVFWNRGDVFFGSVHVDPGAGWFPHTAGFADEVGEGAGAGANRNQPLPPGSGDGPWGDAVQGLATAVADHGADALVVSLGVDAAAGDPESPLEVTGRGFAEAGRSLAALGLPTVFVQEGGYDLDTLGDLVLAVLDGFEEARDR
ncbi:MAG: histone deacetylase family protein [Acidimicrobiales bacterium]